MNRVIFLAFLLVVANLLIGCDSKPAASSAPPSSPPPVTVARPLQKTITEWDEYTGRFSAVESVEVRARVSGFINSVHFKDGQLVKQGDLLFVIDPRPYRLAVEQSTADVERAQGKARYRHARRRTSGSAWAQPDPDRTGIRHAAIDAARRRGAGRGRRGDAETGQAQSRMDGGARPDLRTYLRHARRRRQPDFRRTNRRNAADGHRVDRSHPLRVRRQRS